MLSFELLEQGHYGAAAGHDWLARQNIHRVVTTRRGLLPTTWPKADHIRPQLFGLVELGPVWLSNQLELQLELTGHPPTETG